MWRTCTDQAARPLSRAWPAPRAGLPGLWAMEGELCPQPPVSYSGPLGSALRAWALLQFPRWSLRCLIKFLASLSSSVHEGGDTTRKIPCRASEAMQSQAPHSPSLTITYSDSDALIPVCPCCLRRGELFSRVYSYFCAVASFPLQLLSRDFLKIQSNPADILMPWNPKGSQTFGMPSQA